ncbi:Uncharacterised protein [Mycobacteroides abscessus subsp. abscessus]|nr:Uncharacterised protein [Mycobacteroides abscessus subsp. abscessus]
MAVGDQYIVAVMGGDPVISKSIAVQLVQPDIAAASAVQAQVPDKDMMVPFPVI